MGLFEFLANLFGGDSGYGVDELARRLDMEEADLRNVDVSYQEFSIPKKSGGSRTLHAPSDALKQLQRRILRRLLGKLKSHACATGFERGHSIVTNARTHVGREVVLRMDIRDFFPSTGRKRVENYFRKIGWNREASKLLTELTTWKGGLPQGAPTSPRLSNLVNYRMDARLEGLARSLNAAYSRYADDLTFSFAGDAMSGASVRSPRTGGIVVAEKPVSASRIAIGSVKAILADCGYKMHKRRKLNIRRRHQQQRVTGLVVNQAVNLPRKTRRWLRAVEHRLATTGQSSLTEQQLAGWRALQRMVERQGGRA